jgi:DNA-binding HxlR family transcriptional regulator
VMIRQDGQLGASALRLLAEGPTVQILRELTDHPLRPSELEQRLPDVAHSALMRRLADLAQWGAVTHKRIRELPPRTYYCLTHAGRALLEIPEASERWERRWSAQARQDAPGAWALRLLADEHNRAIMLELVDEQLGPTDLEGHLPGYGRSATRWRLGRLMLNGILARIDDGGPVRYRLTTAARELGSTTMLAAGWEWQWSEAHALLTAPPKPPQPTANAHRTPSLAQAEP